jgi:hypothetical protein
MTLADPIPPSIAEPIFAILAEYAGAHESDRQSFLVVQAEGCREYRFCGGLGFGGKFWNANGRWYVTCYPEDMTPGRESSIRRTNAARAAFRGVLLRGTCR